MNFTKEQREKMYNDILEMFSSTHIVNLLIEDCNELEKELIASRDSRQLSAVPSEEKLASLADCINQELRESNGDEFQIKNIYEDYRPAIKKLVDLNRARGIAG